MEQNFWVWMRHFETMRTPFEFDDMMYHWREKSQFVEVDDGFQNVDSCDNWKSHDPHFEWTAGDLEEFARDEAYARQELEAMAAWWDLEGVRCATFGRDPNRNPYRTSSA